MCIPLRAAVLGLLAVCLPFSLLQAQEPCHNRLWVQVLEEKTGQPVPGAEVAGGSARSLTNADGYCLLEPLCSGQMQLRAAALGFHPAAQGYVLGGEDTLRLLLRPSAQTLDGVEVTGHKQALQTANNATTLQGQDLDRLKGSNLATILATVPGVTMLQTGATIGKPVVNGMHSNRLLILNNGIRQEGQQWGSEHAPEIDPFIAQHITVVKGAEAIRYGTEAIGGVVLVEPPPLPSDSSVHAELNLAGAANGRSGTASAMLSGNLKKLPAFSWRLQGTAKRSGNYSTPDYYLDNSGTRELNYSAALGYHKEHFGLEAFYSHFNTELGIFRGAHIGSREDLEKIMANGRPFTDGSFSYTIDAPRQHIVHDLLKLKGHLHLNDYLHANLQYGFQRDNRREYDLRRGGRTGLASLDLNLYTHTLDAALEYFNGSSVKATIGGNMMYQDNANVPGTGVTPLIPDYVSRSAGLYALGRFIRPRYELDAGLRYDYKYLSALGYRDTILYGERRNFHNVSASLGAVWYPLPRIELRSNLGSAWRPPAVNELYSAGLHHGSAQVENGDSSLQSEKSIKWITSLQYRNMPGWLRVDADVYLNYFDGYIYLLPAGYYSETLRGTFPVWDYRRTNARFLGADLSAQLFFLKRLDYLLKVSIVRAKDISNNRYLPMIPADRVEQQIRWKYDPLPFLQGTYLQLAHVFVARQNRFDPASDYAPPPDAYHLLNFGIGTQLKAGKHSLDVHFSIDNLTNTLYKDYMNRFRYYAHDLGRNYTLRLTYRI